MKFEMPVVSVLLIRKHIQGLNVIIEYSVVAELEGRVTKFNFC